MTESLQTVFQNTSQNVTRLRYARTLCLHTLHITPGQELHISINQSVLLTFEEYKTAKKQKNS